MSEKTKEMQLKLKDLGYFASEDLVKTILLFEAAGKREKKNIPALLLQGKSGAGKTFLAETFSKLIEADEEFVQCFPRMGTENFQYDVNIKGIMEQDAENSIKEGILLQTLQKSKEGPVVLVIDELDKARPEVDSFLLDFLENGRLSTGTEVYERGEYPIYTFITSNDKREIDEALLNRTRKVEVPRPTKELFLEILGVPQDHYLGYVYDKCPDFSIRQAKQYLGDLDVLGVEMDEQALSQYINLEQLDVVSLDDLQHLSQVQGDDFEFELTDLERCRMGITSRNIEEWMEFFKSGNKTGLTLYSDPEYRNNFYTYINSLEQLKEVSEYIDFENSEDYEGWFRYSWQDDGIQQDDVIWAENEDRKGKVRFGLKVVGDEIFRIASDGDNAFVRLDTSRNKTLETFLGQPEKNIEQEYETDLEYDDNGREYDD